MRFSKSFIKTFRKPPSDEESVNAKLLEQAGFIRKLGAGIYTFLPLGWKTLDRIENIVRDEMRNAGGEEILMPALHPKENWEKTGRWEGFDALYRLESRHGQEYALGPTHEEILYPLLTRYVKSYRDLPVSLFQIQTKFRDEPRAKSGLMRGREFRMKDLYSFHTDNHSRDSYYEVMRKAYHKIFKRLGLKALETKASGGTFSELSHEFQVVSASGEDTIFVCQKCEKAINKEISTEAGKCEKCGSARKEEKAIEVGNIFPLKEKYAKDFDLKFKDKNGEDKLVSAGCYGLGTSRAMGAIVEVSHDSKGIIWPEEISPFSLYLISLPGNSAAKTKKWADEIYEKLKKENIEVLYDDLEDKSPGEKFTDADLIGIPSRVVVSEKNLNSKKIGFKKRGEEKEMPLALQKLIKIYKNDA